MGLAPEPLPITGIVGQAFGEQLEGNYPVMGLVIGPIDLAHAATAEHALDPVRTELLHRTPIHDHTPFARSPARDPPRLVGLACSPCFAAPPDPEAVAQWAGSP